MRILAALTVTMIAAVLAASVALHSREAETIRPRILSVQVLNGSAVMLDAPKSPHPVETYLVDGDTVRLLAHVEGLDALDVGVSVNSRTNFGQFSGHFLSGRYLVIEVDLPEPGSLWTAPGPGVGSPPQPYTIDDGEAFILQITGTGGRDVYGEPLAVHTGMRVARSQ